MKYSLELSGSHELFTPLRGADETHSTISFDRMMAVVRRQWRVVILCVILSAVIGAAYQVTAVRVYSASAGILLRQNNSEVVSELSQIMGVLSDETAVLSQVELLKSQRIARAVSNNLDLKNNAAFLNPPAGPVGNILATIRAMLSPAQWLGGGEERETPEQVQLDILQILGANLKVDRVGQTYVVNLSYSSPDPVLAARIAKAYSEAYLTDQLDSKYEATRRASEWLQTRIAELKQKSIESDLAVQKFTAEKGLLSTDGLLISERNLRQLNTDLTIAKADMATAEARYSQIKSIIDSGEMEAAVTEALESKIITDLRGKYLEASRKETDISNRLGSSHVQAVRLRNQKNEYRRLMFEELGRIAEGYQSNMQVAVARFNNLQQQVTSATSVSASANDNQVQLRELTREAEAYKKLYETFLNRYQEAVQQQSFPVTEARIIASPTVPDRPSAPKGALVLALSMFLGVAAGAALGAFREFRDRFFRTSDQIRDILELEPLGAVPYSRQSPGSRHRHAIDGPIDARVISKDNPISNYVVDHPLSPFAETMRSAKIAIDVLVGQKRPKIVGVVSALPGEGKSTVSINFAELLASQGSRVLLIDADLRNPSVTRQLASNAEQGILEALQDSVSVHDILMSNPDTGLALMPAVIKRRIPYSSELLASEAMDRIIRELSVTFDYIVFDLPPLAPVVDARAMSSRIDSFLFVVEWGKTGRNVVKKTLVDNRIVAEKCAGVILNKVDTDKLKFYQTDDSTEMQYSRYTDYYKE